MIKGFTQQIQAKDRNAPIIRPSAIYLFPFLLVTILSLCSTFEINAQYTRQDSLRGTLSEIRSCYDVTFYDLYVKVNPAEQLIEGHNTIYYKDAAYASEEEMLKPKEYTWESLSKKERLFYEKYTRKLERERYYARFSSND
jgi:hypothetical protein